MCLQLCCAVQSAELALSTCFGRGSHFANQVKSLEVMLRVRERLESGTESLRFVPMVILFHLLDESVVVLVDGPCAGASNSGIVASSPVTASEGRFAGPVYGGFPLLEFLLVPVPGHYSIVWMKMPKLPMQLFRLLMHPRLHALALLVRVLLEPLVVNSSLRMVSVLDGQARVCV